MQIEQKPHKGKSNLGWMIAVVAGISGSFTPAVADSEQARTANTMVQVLAEVSAARPLRKSEKTWRIRGKLNPEPFKNHPTAQISTADGCMFAHEFMHEEAAQVYKAFVNEEKYQNDHKPQGFMLAQSEVSTEAELHLITTQGVRPRRLQKVVERARYG